MEMSSGEDETTKLFRIRRTVLQKLSDRGYLVGDFELKMTQNQFVEKFGETVKRDYLFINKYKRNDPSDQIYVFFPEEAKVSVKTVTTCIDRMKSENVFTAILVVQQKLVPFAKLLVNKIITKFKLEVLQEAELLVNIKEHVLIPSHEVLMNEEQKTLLEQYTSEETQAMDSSPTDSCNILQLEPKHCKCAKKAIVRISETEADLNRPFYSCPQNSDQNCDGCDFFEWCYPSIVRTIVDGVSLRDSKSKEMPPKENSDATAMLGSFVNSNQVQESLKMVESQVLALEKQVRELKLNGIAILVVLLVIASLKMFS